MKNKKVKSKEIKLSPVAVLILTIVIVGLAIFFLIHDAEKANSAFSLVKKLYTALFSK